jgi:predicted nucleic acid-binding protein
VIVVDASAIVELLIKSDKAQTVEGMLLSEQAHAPTLIGFEVLSAIRGCVRGGLLTPANATAAMLNFEGVEANLELWPLLESMSDRAIDLRENVTAYGASYVALAEILGCPLVTTDGKLARAVQSRIDVTLV